MAVAYGMDEKFLEDDTDRSAKWDYDTARKIEVTTDPGAVKGLRHRFSRCYHLLKRCKHHTIFYVRQIPRVHR